MSIRAAPRQLRSAQVSLIGVCVQPVVLLSLQLLLLSISLVVLLAHLHSVDSGFVDWWVVD